MATNKEKKDIQKNPATADDDKAINENELESVSGGLWDITIMDTCENVFVFDKCFANFWGQCPKLIIDSQKLSAKHQMTYCFSCSKGCFTKLSHIADNFGQ